MNPGEPHGWDVRPFLEAADLLVRADEVQRALWLLDNLPGYYRDHVPPEVKELRDTIWQRLRSALDYAINPLDEVRLTETHSEWMLDSTLRGVIVRQDVEALNERGVVPHLVDFGPGEYWLPLGLRRKALKFTYAPLGVQLSAMQQAKQLLHNHWLEGSIPEDRPVFFVACEVVEHLWNEYELYQALCKAGGRADRIYLSTPKYTFAGGRKSWRDERDLPLEHLRTYTPREFVALAQRVFPSYRWTYHDNPVMVLTGTPGEREGGELGVEIASHDPISLVESALQQAEGLADKGDLEGALEAFQRAQSLEADGVAGARQSGTSIRARVGMAGVHLHTGRIDQAIDGYVGAVRQTIAGEPSLDRPGGDEAEQRAMVAQLRGQDASGGLQSAYDYLYEAARLHPERPRLRLALADLLLDAGEAEAVVEVLGAGMTDPPQDSGLYLRLGIAFLLLHRWEEARHAFEIAHSLAPHSTASEMGLLAAQLLSRASGTP